MGKVQALVLCAILFQGCVVNRRPPNICGVNGFTLSPLEHIVEEIERPFYVRNVKGRLRSETGDWPEDWPILFEIRRTGKAAKIIKANADAEGNFEIPGLTDGWYCFKATVNGWRSVMGLIRVDKKAGPTETVAVTMKVGV
jgi:hypothetical protein